MSRQRLQLLGCGPDLVSDGSKDLLHAATGNLTRSRQHLIVRAAPGDLVTVVGEMVGLHAQVMGSAELQAAARIDGLRPTDVRDALWERRSLVKTWAYRQTLHLLTADDLAEFVIAARSLERWHAPAWLRYFGLTEEAVAEVLDAI